MAKICAIPITLTAGGKLNIAKCNQTQLKFHTNTRNTPVQTRLPSRIVDTAKNKCTPTHTEKPNFFSKNNTSPSPQGIAKRS